MKEIIDGNKVLRDLKEMLEFSIKDNRDAQPDVSGTNLEGYATGLHDGYEDAYMLVLMWALAYCPDSE